MKKRKMLISIALVAIMLLNCIMPLFEVNAAENQEIKLNKNLYTAVKASLQKQGFEFESSDVTHKIILTDEVKSSITTLNLNDSTISDLTGLDAFSSLNRLELSGNKLTKNSNLEVLNKLPNLNYLDLSSNELEDISAISELINRIRSESPEAVVLSGQNVTTVYKAEIDTLEESDNASTAKFVLPQILELAGYLKPKWQTEERFAQSIKPYQTSTGTPSIKNMPMTVTAENNCVQVNVADANTGKGKYGLLKLTIYIHDDKTEMNSANNVNKASENILNESEFTLYFIVYDGQSEAITTMDTNLYNAIKEQLTGGQTTNNQLASYPYAIDTDGNIIYEEYTYVTKNGYHILSSKDTKKQYAYDPNTKVLYTYNGSSIGSRVDTTVEPIEIRTVGDDGTVTLKQGYRIAFKSEATGVTLYQAAYDEAKTFVIDDLILTNKITSLILNNKQIRDLSGIEYFVGLNENLNVSHNYLSDIYALTKSEEQKGNWESQVIEKYTNWLNGRSYGNLSTATTAAKASKDGIKENIEAIQTANEEIIELLKSASEIEPAGDKEGDEEKYNDAIAGVVSSIDEKFKAIYGYTNEKDEYVKGYLDLIKDNISNSKQHTGLNYEIQDMYNYLSKLYNVYNNEYKLTTFLAPTLNYQTYEEYETYLEAVNQKAEDARGLLEEQVNYVSTLEANEGLSELDKLLLTEEFGIDFDDKETETPFADYFSNYLQRTALNRLQVVSLIDKFREIGIYSEMANYCLIKRMNEETAVSYCYEQEYLLERIKQLDYEDIPSTIEYSILTSIQQNVNYDKLFKIYSQYSEKSYSYYHNKSDENKVFVCKGPYTEIDSIKTDNTPYTDQELKKFALEGSEKYNSQAVQDVLDDLQKDIIKQVNLYEKIDCLDGISSHEHISSANELVLYEQLISLATKLLNGDVSRYVSLPRLKVLDVSYNADIYLDGLETLTSLVDLNASYCYIADVTEINWEALNKLRKLNLAYNYISDISEVIKLTNLKYLNLSNNLIAGKLSISPEDFRRLGKKLEELDLSGNQIDDISTLVMYLDYITGGNYANYLAREDTININLQNQNLEINVEPYILIQDYPSTVNIELPPIFTQLLAIDTERTAFGQTSQMGRIESEGTYATLCTETLGEKVAVVNVIAMSGNGKPVDTCVGKGTTLTIKYNVVDKIPEPENPDKGSSSSSDKALTITVTPAGTFTKKPGETIEFEGVVEGKDVENTNIIWAVENNTSDQTQIAEGVLTIGEDENADSITVTATAEADPKAVVTITINIEKDAEVDGVDSRNELQQQVQQQEEERQESQHNQQTVPQQEVKPSVVPAEKTTIDPNTLGYVKDEEYLKDVLPKTSISDFKREFLNGKDYEVVVTNEGSDVAIESGYVETGMLVKLLDKNGKNVVDENGEPICYEIVVKGDVNGDGLANSVDSILIKSHRTQVQTLKNAYLKSADINDDGKINVEDTKLLLYHRAEVKGYVFNYSK